MRWKRNMILALMRFVSFFLIILLKMSARFFTLCGIALESYK